MFLKILNNNKQILNSDNDDHKDGDNNDCSSSNDINKIAVYHTVNKAPVNSSSNGETALTKLE
jgi:hypothetical protein